MKVLFCTDGSSKSFNAINNFSKLFNEIETDILSVSDMTYFNDNILMYNDKIIEQCSNNVDSIIKTAEEYLENIGIRAEKRIKKCGNTVDQILTIESKNEYEYIVMGSNGKKGIQKWLGSVSQEVASKSKTPVYISKTRKNINNILFPVSRNMYLNNGLSKIINKSNLTNKNISLISIYEMPEFLFLSGNIDSNWITDVEMKQRKESIDLLKSIEKIFIERGITVADKAVIKGNPTEEILKYINDYYVSLTILGMKNTHKRNTSISKNILEQAECDIIIDKNI